MTKRHIRRSLGKAIPAVLVLLVAMGARADYTGPNKAVLFPHGPLYDYAPAVMMDGSLQKFWWCGYDTVSSTDAIFYRTYDGQTQTWSPIQVVLRVTAGAWDGRFVCDPSLVKGSFTDSGTTYTYALYYTATDDPVSNNRIGVAFSNDGVTWTKYSGNPIIYPQVYPTTTYGAGQQTVYSHNGIAGVWMMHTDTSPTGGVFRQYFRQSTDGKNFGSPTLVTSAGNDVAPDLGYDYNTATWYLVIARRPPRSGDQAEYQMGIYRMPASSFPTGTWTLIGEIDTDLTGFDLNHNGAFLRDIFGNVTPWLPTMHVYFGAGQQSSGTWDLSGAQVRESPNTLDWKRHYNSSTADHWDTPGYIALGWGFESSLGKLLQAPVAGSHEVFQCLRAGWDHKISLQVDCEGAYKMGTVGWLYDSAASGRHAVYLCSQPGPDFFSSTNPACEGQVVHATLGYALD